MLEITVEGTFESTKGIGQADIKNFKYTIKTSRLNYDGIETHLQKRYVPMEIKNDKKMTGVIFSKLKSFRVIDCKELKETSPLQGKLFSDLDEAEIQDLASTYDLYNVPLPYLYSIMDMREKATIEFLRVVLKVPMKTYEEKIKCPFLIKDNFGDFKLNREATKNLYVDIRDLKPEKKEEDKVSADFYLDKFYKKTTNEIDEVENKEIDQSLNKMPSIKDLENI